jgi:ligand-binding sensor domain-containing protein
MSTRPFIALALPLLAASAFAQTTELSASGSARWTLMDLGRLPSPEVVAVARDDRDNTYYATRGGLTAEDKTGGFKVFTRAGTKGELASDSLTCLGLDRYRDLWIGTDGGGLHVLSGGASGGTWKRHTVESTRGGLPDDGVLSLAMYREERWVGTRNGFAALRGASWITYTGERIAGRLPHPAVSAIAVDSSGDKWLGTLGGLVRLRGATWERFTPENTGGGLPHHGITALFVDAGNRLWVGTQAGLARRDPDGAWLRIGMASGLGQMAGERVTAVTGGPDGVVWASLRGGAARFTPSTPSAIDGDWKLYTRENVPGLLTLYVNYVFASGAEDFVIATQKGVIARVPARDPANE